MPVIVGVSVVVFSIVHVLPGDPVLAILSGANATPEQEQELRAQLRLEDPLPLQYARFVARAAVGDFGRSIFTRRPVLEEITESTEALLMEGMRQLDEFRRIEPELPQRDQMCVILSLIHI